MVILYLVMYDRNSICMYLAKQAILGYKTTRVGITVNSRQFLLTAFNSLFSVIIIYYL